MTEVDTKGSLDEVARQIEVQARKSDEHVISAAMLMREARRRVDDGEAGDIKWYAWALKNIKLSSSRLYELQCIAAAKDPAAEIERLRLLIRERAKKHRERKAAETRVLEEERRSLIAWAKKAPIEKVKQVLKQVGNQADHTPTALIETHPTAGRQQAA